MSFKSFLEKAGEDILRVISFGAVAAKDAAPFISIADPALGALINVTATAIITAEAAGTSAVSGAPVTANGAQKSALAITAIEPEVLALAKSLGIPKPTQAEMQQWIDGFVLAFKAFKVPVPETVVQNA